MHKTTDTVESVPRHHRTIWYMGVKTRVLPNFLDEVLADEAPRGATVVDLMSGSAAVAAHCANRYRVYANDVQRYAQVISSSLIEHDPLRKSGFLESIDARSALDSAFSSNLRALEKLYSRALEAEESLLKRYASGDESDQWCADYRQFLNQPRSVYAATGQKGRASHGGPYEEAQALLSDESIAAYRLDPSRRPACLTTAYYANIYFGLRQSIVIDSLRAAIEDLPGSSIHAKETRTHYLSALLHVASISTSGTSHFAQPRHTTKDSELKALAARRTIDIFERFQSWSLEIAAKVRETTHLSGNQTFSAPYREFIIDGGQGPELRFPGPVDLVYLDPPYTADHYSRFYHVLEVLARHDYPELDRDASGSVLRGRYPKLAGRFQSEFCLKTRVEEEFRTVVHATAGAGAKLVISYASPTGLLLKEYVRRFPEKDPVERLRQLCGERYETVRVERMPLMHSGQGDSNLQIDEILVVCARPRGPKA